MTGFSGSYDPADVTFLLKQVPVRELDVKEKERFIQKEGGHYSQVLSPERAPSAAYLALFDRQLELSASRVAQDVRELAAQIASRAPLSRKVTLVSLARAGTPVGVLVHRLLALGHESTHYCVSIFRDKGLDLNALDHIRRHHSDESIVFVDGWTGKGVVGRQLAADVAAYNLRHGAKVSGALHVLADISGTAAVSATRDDYLLPSAILNGPVSGLVSRTVLNEHVGPTDFHGCTLLPHLQSIDRTRAFVDRIWDELFRSRPAQPVVAGPAVDSFQLGRTIERYMRGHGITDVNLVKPGVGEATRVLLRRSPLLLSLRSKTDPYVEHLLQLAKEKSIPTVEDPTLPCRALALIDSPD